MELLEVCAYLAILLLTVSPLGRYMASVLDRGPGRFKEQSWREYAAAMLWLNLLGALGVYTLLRLQLLFPWNPQSLPAVAPFTAFNIAISFASNTNWQNYAGETTLSYFTQMAALTVQNFLSAATGIAVAAALARGLARKQAPGIGNFWADVTRATLYILLPLSFLLALALVSQGVIQNLEANQTVAGQVLPMGPAASQVAIKQLGTNGGGFFNVNSAHPFENPTPLSNFLEMLAILLIPAAMCDTFGRMTGDRRQGWALLAVMVLIFVPLLGLVIHVEQGNWEGKELRFGTANSAIWAAATTAASNGSVNAMHDSFTPIGGLVLLFLMQLGEVVFGGVGSGLYGMVIFALLAVFVAGLMVGRTPEYMGKKIEAFEMQMVSIAILVPPGCVLIGSAVAMMTSGGTAGLLNHGPHGFSEILYAFTSMGNNNGSAFAGYGADTPLVNVTGGLAMLLARYWVAAPVLAVAGSLAAKKTIPAGPGTLATHTPLFVGLLASVVVVVGALAFLPALALGPVVEHLQVGAK